MATKYPRIGVTKDPELARALKVTRSVLYEKEVRSEAGQVRSLALVGASALTSGSANTAALKQRRRILNVEGVRPASYDLSDLDWLDRDPIDFARKASEALDQVRGNR